MFKPWSKMSKDEKLAYANYKLLKGFGLFVFGIMWSYFASVTNDIWTALPPTITVIGAFLAYFGYMKRVMA